MSFCNVNGIKGSKGGFSERALDFHLAGCRRTKDHKEIGLPASERAKSSYFLLDSLQIDLERLASNSNP